MNAQEQSSGYPVWHVMRRNREDLVVGGLCVYRWHVTEHGTAYACNKETYVSCNMHAAAARGVSHKDDHSPILIGETPERAVARYQS